ncbi:Bacterial regulatory protein, arsR family [Candidatus Burarchaeum australiense]|nr:Bacterial regulatory protein, arsR family [Candidatus Burarchaeum australiense]
MDSKTRLLYWLLNASRGGPTRVKLLRSLEKKPANIRQLSLALGLDYKTVQGHVKILLENGLLDTPQKRYGSIYFLGAEWTDNDYLMELLRGDSHDGENGENGKKREKRNKIE